MLENVAIEQVADAKKWPGSLVHEVLNAAENEGALQSPQCVSDNQ